jgi:hypothetical protein
MQSLERPTCQTPDCNNPSAPINYNTPSGIPLWRKWCAKCHDKRTAEKHGLSSITEVIAKNAGFDSYREYLEAKAIAEGYNSLAEKRNAENEATAKNAGFDSYTEYVNSKHPYRRKRKNYCENIDKRLGYPCTTTIISTAMLDVDHIDGNPENNDEANLQTLCKCCHVYKTLKNKDYLTEGRTALKNKSKNTPEDNNIDKVA